MHCIHCKDSFFRYTDGNFKEIGIGIEKNFSTGVLESLLSPPYDLSSFHIYGTIFDGATFERGLDPQKILVFELWRVKCSKKEKIGFLGGCFSACFEYFLELVYINYESTCIGPTVAKK